MEKVQRLGGSGLLLKEWLKIESGPAERRPGDERPNQPGASGVIMKRECPTNTSLLQVMGATVPQDSKGSFSFIR
jgi:hypothetical protein